MKLSRRRGRGSSSTHTYYGVFEKDVEGDAIKIIMTPVMVLSLFRYY